MALLKDGKTVEDAWRRIEQDAGPVGDGFVLYSLEQWQDVRSRLGHSNEPLGLWLRSDQSPQEIAADVPRFSVIAVEFPKFTDGRPYSAARLLRERYGFKGELRAVGQVLRDQLAFMARCGFDAFAVPDSADLDAWTNAFHSFSHWYQATSDGLPTVARLRSRRKAVVAV